MLFSFILFLFCSQGEAAERLVSLKPNVTDLIVDMGVGGDLVGATTFCSLPPDKSGISRIADYVHIDLERLMALRPTLIIGSEENSLKKDVEFLTGHGVNVKLFSFSRLPDTFQSIEEIGRLIQREKMAHEIVARMKTSLKAHAVLGVKPRVLMVVGRHPLVVVGSGNFLNDLLGELNAVNLAGASKIRYPTFSVEQLLAARPDVILDLVMGTEASTLDEGRRFYSQFQSLPAGQTGRIHFLDINDFHPSGRLTVGIKKLGAALAIPGGSRVQ